MSEIAKHWIDGERTASGTVSESVNPAPGVVVGQCADGGEAETRAAIASARRAFDASPSPGTAALRQRVLSEMADRFDAHAEELARWSRRRTARRQPKAYSRVQSPATRSGTPQRRP